ncbi:hypothetical protein ZIOFF_073218 [Zingiber officinale]|uniref:DUF4219 domain-containing protein n=1 Tax=Zingiber officinale TaxID=94328 RepID=A0A8J5C733_ZINOF|nr:hypothetical protein ZIOFF_073218 [Zingiber officinale]
MASTSSLQVSKLTKDNYKMWSIQMEALLGFLDVWDLVETEYTIAETSNGNEQALKVMKKREKALFTIYQGVDETTFKLITLAITSQEAWEILKITYDGVDKEKKILLQTLRAQFEALQQEPSKLIFDYFSRFDFIVVAIEESKDLEVMAVEELMGGLWSI